MTERTEEWTRISRKRGRLHLIIHFRPITGRLLLEFTLFGVALDLHCCRLSILVVSRVIHDNCWFLLLRPADHSNYKYTTIQTIQYMCRLCARFNKDDSSLSCQYSQSQWVTSQSWCAHLIHTHTHTQLFSILSPNLQVLHVPRIF